MGQAQTCLISKFIRATFWMSFIGVVGRSATNGEQEPDNYDHLPVHLLPFLAGIVHKLCNDYELELPDWVHKDKYFLPELHFAFNANGKAVNGMNVDWEE